MTSIALLKNYLLSTAKSLEKRLVKASKRSDLEGIGVWIRSIINHLYWCAVSSPVGDGDMIVAKWLSLVNHICNKVSFTSRRSKGSRPVLRHNDKVTSLIIYQLLYQSSILSQIYTYYRLHLNPYFQHRGHPDVLFKKCAHGRLTRRGRESKAWIKLRKFIAEIYKKTGAFIRQIIYR